MNKLQAWLAAHLVPDWRRAHRMASVLAAAALALLSMAQADVLPLVQPLVPADKWPWVSGGFALAIGLLRIIKQVSVSGDQAQEGKP